MPNEKVLLEKQQYVAELKDKLTNAAAGVLVDYKGITVADDTKLRKELREAGVEYRVVKNTMLRLALKDTPYEEISNVLKTPPRSPSPTMTRSSLQRSSANTSRAPRAPTL